ncbi:MAG TPA: thiamine phosphate synthase [Thermodesulfovibrionales bacterium]|nr:thiamine phosphate synthase [Thermodesulfovibrionales bacterium]
MIAFRLYLITDRRLFVDRDSLLNGVEDALRAGVKAVQLREKDMSIKELLDTAYRMKGLTSGYGARLFVNDRIDVALCTEADGVHLGQTGIPVHAVRKMVGKKMLIGASTHNLTEALAAEKEGADFITFGPLYDTPSKRRFGKPLGLDVLKSVSEKLSVPVFGIGGIKQENIRDVIRSGAYGIALIRGILGEVDVAVTARKYLGELELGEQS